MNSTSDGAAPSAGVGAFSEMLRSTEVAEEGTSIMTFADQEAVHLAV